MKGGVESIEGTEMQYSFSSVEVLIVVKVDSKGQEHGSYFVPG